MYLYGASGHAKVIIEILELCGIGIDGIVDDNREIKELLGYKVVQLADIDKFEKNWIISIGDNAARKKLPAALTGGFATAIHPSANISKRSSVASGSVIMAGVSVNSNVKIGSHTILNTNCSIDHDSVIEDFVHISPNATLAGNVEVGEGTHIGIGACVIQNIKIGQWCTIGAGAVIIKDVPDFATVVGNPGRITHSETH